MDRNSVAFVFGFGAKLVALRKESVDRNRGTNITLSIIVVALRKESVDRNSFYSQQWHLAQHVALRKESVDRNIN